MRKIHLDEKMLSEFMEKHSVLYASDLVKNKSLRFYVTIKAKDTDKPKFTVTYGEKYLYEGTDMKAAIMAWDSV